MRRSPHVFGCYSFGKSLIFGLYRLCSTRIHVHPYKLAPVLKPFAIFSFSVAWWFFRTFRTVMKYSRIYSAVCPYSNTSSTINFDVRFFKPCYLASFYHSIFRFIVIATHIVAALRYHIGINFHRLFPSGVKNANLSRDSSSNTTCQYPLSIFTEIKYFASVSMY